MQQRRGPRWRPWARWALAALALACLAHLPARVTAAGVADLLQQAAASGGGGASSTVTVVGSPPPSGPPAPAEATPGGSPSPGAVTPVTSPTPDSSSGGGGLNAGAILGGGFAPSPSPPPLMPPFPPGQVAMDPSKVDNSMQSYTVASMADMVAAVAAASARNCTQPCSTINVVADITLGSLSDTLRLSGPAYINGACSAGTCKIDGGGKFQIMKIEGYYAYADIRNIEFANGRQDQATVGVFGGAVEVFNLGKAVFTDCKFTKNTAGRAGAVACYAGASANFTNCDFVGNNAQTVGGAVLVGGASSYAKKCRFVDNSAGQGGGAIEMEGQDTMLLEDCTFQGSEAGNGWGPDIYLRYSTQSKLYITPPDTAVGVEPSDGAILIYAPPSPPSPPPSPSPMSPPPLPPPAPPSPPHPAPRPPPPPQPPAPPAPPSFVVNSEAQLAAAIKGRKSNIQLMGHIVLTGQFGNESTVNLLPDLEVPTTITGFCTTLGGLCILDAKQLGRILYGSGPWIKLTLVNVRLVNGNSRDESGGAVLLENGGSLEASNCAFERNWGRYGGAIDVKNGSAVTITGASFYSNKAGISGGALRTQGNLLCTGCTFNQNKAPLGGAVDLAPNTWAGFQQYTFTGNDAVKAGDDIAMDSANTTVLAFDPFPPTGVNIYPNGTEKRDRLLNITIVWLGESQRPEGKPLPAAPVASPPPPPLPPASPPAPPRADPFKPSILAYSERDLAAALQIPNAVIGLKSHVVPTGAVKSDKSLFPYVQYEITIVGMCNASEAQQAGQNWGTKCTIDAKRLWKIFYITPSDPNTGGPRMKVTFKNLRFMNGNSKMGFGGAVEVFGPVDVTFINCEFGGSISGDAGAVGIVSAGVMKFINCAFYDNYCQWGSGGAVSTSAETWFVGCSFERNIVGNNGGAVLLEGGCPAGFFLDYWFKGNWADGQGKDIYVRNYYSTQALFDVMPDPDGAPNVFHEAAVYQYTAPPPAPPSPPSPPPPPFPDPPKPPRPPRVDPPSPPPPPKPPAPSPPAVLVPPKKAYSEQDLWDMIQDTWNDEVQVGVHIKFADDGPWATNGAPTITRPLTIIGKCGAVNSNGGACFLDAQGWSQNILRVSGSNGRVTLRNLRFTGVQSSDAGAVVVDMGADVQAWYCDFSRNTAAVGAGLTVRDPQSSAELSFCSLWQNSADGNGGAISISSGSVSLINCSLSQNTAMYGGGIAMDSSAALSAANTSWSNNNAFVFGDDLYVEDPSSSRVYLDPYPDPVAIIYPSKAGKTWKQIAPAAPAEYSPPRPPHPPYPPPSPPKPPKPSPPPNPPPSPAPPLQPPSPPSPPPPPVVPKGRPFPFGSYWSWSTSIGFVIWFIVGILTMAFLVLTVVFHKRIFSPIPWDYTRIKLEEPPAKAGGSGGTGVAKSHASGAVLGQFGDMERQDPNEVVETPTMLHIMGQNNLLQRTGFRKDDAELEE
ncbi:hypothetical protein ABPG75_001616 [Micractinium tetrahymenae]